MFRKLIAPIAALLALAGCQGNEAATQPVKKDIGLQLYSIRTVIGNPELYAQNHEAAFKALAEMGYTAVEAASYSDGKFYGVSPEQYKQDVEAAGLVPLSSHTTLNLTPEQLKSKDFSEAMEWWDECIAAHKAAGMKYIVTPSFRIPDNLEDLQTWCEYFNAVGKKCREAGIIYGYHNHSREFAKIGDEVIEDYLITHTDPENVFFQMDVYWTVYGQAAPVDYFKKYPGRFRLLHIKDKLEIGQSGMVGFDAIFKNAATAGMEYLIVEQEKFSFDDWKESVKMSADYLLEAPFVEPTYVK